VGHDVLWALAARIGRATLAQRDEFHEFKTLDDGYFKTGLRLVDLDMREAPNDIEAIWHPGSGAQYWRKGLSWSDFKTKDLDFFNQGLRLVKLFVGITVGGGIWRPGTGAQYWQTFLSWDEFKQQTVDFFNQGLRLQDFEAIEPL
jgi:hypothetical protein